MRRKTVRKLLTIAAVLLMPWTLATEATATSGGSGKYGTVRIPTVGCTLLGGVNGSGISFRLSAPAPTVSGVNVNRRRVDRTFVRYFVVRLQKMYAAEPRVVEASHWSALAPVDEGRWTSWVGGPTIMSAGAGDTWTVAYSFEWWRKKGRKWQHLGEYIAVAPNYAMSYGGSSMGTATSCSSPWGDAGPAPLPPIPWP